MRSHAHLYYEMGQGMRNGDLSAESQALSESQENARVSSVNLPVLENITQSKQKFGFISPFLHECILMWQNPAFGLCISTERLRCKLL